jgi:hypothetical protein
MPLGIMVIIAAKARLRPSGSPARKISIMRVGTICQAIPKRSFSHPHSISRPPSTISAAHSRSISACVSHGTMSDTASENLNCGPPFSPMKGCPISSNSTVSTAPSAVLGLSPGAWPI